MALPLRTLAASAVSLLPERLQVHLESDAEIAFRRLQRT